MDSEELEALVKDLDAKVEEDMNSLAESMDQLKLVGEHKLGEHEGHYNLLCLAC